MRLNRVTRGLVERSFENISAPARPTQPAWLCAAWEQADRELATAPPLTLHLPRPALFAGAWAVVRESHLAGPTSRVLREVIATTVSTLNECPYCVDSHVASTSAFGHDGVAKALRSGAVDSIGAAELRAAALWAAATRSPGDPLLAHPPFDAADLPYAAATALTFHYVNRMVSAFLKPGPAPLPAFIAGRGFMTRVMAKFPGRLLAVPNLEPGASLEFCEPGPPLAELAPLEPAPAVAAAWAALAGAAEDAGAASLSAPARTAVGSAIREWRGEDPQLGPTWADNVTGQLAPDDHVAAQFALLCAVAPYRITRRRADAVKDTGKTDADLVGIAAWASMRATRRIATWLWPV